MRLHTLRDRLTVLAVLVAAIAIGVLTVTFNLLLAGSLDHDARSRLRTAAAAASTTVSVRDGRVGVADAPNDSVLDGKVWVFQGARLVERASGDPELQRSAAALAGQAGVFDDLPNDRQIRLYAAPVRAGGRQVGTIVVALSLAAYDRTTDLAGVASVALAAILILAVLLLTRVTIGRAFAPVLEMTRAAAEWSENEPERRFGSELRPDELGDLARTFDALLDRVAAGLRHEQRLSAELSHELRTPLSRIVAEVELLQRRDRPLDERQQAYTSIARSAEQMSAILETLMAAARAEAGLDRGRCSLPAALAELRATWAPVLLERGVRLQVAPPRTAQAHVGVDAEVVARIVAPVLDNAGRFARTRVTITTVDRDGGVAIVVDDDGPGVGGDDPERAFEPGVQLADDNGHRGSGLGLPLARRLARAAHGDVRVEDGPGDGARFVIELPR
ncbi:sensor histidine kinase [Baekduia soli]|uniref:sensor histidine kinase n=1 Tax=Baekduia soli TaxID=496014 RepID=UPI001652A6EA|nr:HAMP domain-containing sensor histidine kinase [Baekduia soli]